MLQCDVTSRKVSSGAENVAVHTATHCSTLQHTATHCNTLQRIAALCKHCNTLQHTATHYDTRLYNYGRSLIVCPYLPPPHYITPQHTATHSNPPQHTATHCNTLQHIATHCNTLQPTVCIFCLLILRVERLNSPLFKKWYSKFSIGMQNRILNDYHRSLCKQLI